MFEDLRDDQHTRAATAQDPVSADPGTQADRPKVGFLGMTSGQRLAVAILVLLAVCLLGTTCLLATGAIRTF
jgi:hypothetical protein